MLGLDLDERSRTQIVNKLITSLDNITQMRYLLEREFGKVPADPETKKQELESSTSENSKKPFIRDETTITEEKIIAVGANVTADAARSGFLVNCHGANKLKIAWEERQGGGYLPAYTVAPNEIVNFDNERIRNLKIMLYGDNNDAAYKFILK